jgi:hypothetical protein
MTMPVPPNSSAGLSTEHMRDERAASIASLVNLTVRGMQLSMSCNSSGENSDAQPGVVESSKLTLLSNNT